MSPQRTVFLSVCVLLLLLPVASEADSSSIETYSASTCSQNGESGSTCSRSLIQSNAVRMSVKAKTAESKSGPKSSKDKNSKVKSSKVGDSKTAAKKDEKASKTNTQASRTDSKLERKQVEKVQEVGVDAKAKASPKVDSKKATVSKSQDMEDHVDHMDHMEHAAMTPGLVQEEANTSLRERLEQNLRMLSQGFISNLLSIIFVVAGVLVLVLAGLIVVQAQQKGSGAQNYGQLASTMSSRPSLASMSPSMPPSARSIRSAPRPTDGRPGGTSPRGSEADAGSALFLCPELVVPAMTECTLQVPHLQQSTQTKVQVSIDDSKNCPVFRVEYFPIPQPDGTALVLASPAGDLTFATLKVAAKGALGSFASGGSTTELQIFSKNQTKTPFGTISVDGDNWKVTTLKTGRAIRFEGKWITGRMSALNADEQDQLLAVSDQASDGKNGEKRRDIRIGPLVDAGLMAISFLAVDILSLQRSQTPSFSASRFG
eukprot:TRINITY_DN3367_c0_g1_i2.p1 TRINITY_DN3367_c0_g1~~TRINITY_DN3367_c0_g1_i2.p1  ORF type:complete len:487 (-),score=109.93 TRINITY_DN3367_c0_g1_i2:306-1766(-)